MSHLQNCGTLKCGQLLVCAGLQYEPQLVCVICPWEEWLPCLHFYQHAPCNEDDVSFPPVKLTQAGPLIHFNSK